MLRLIVAIKVNLELVGYFKYYLGHICNGSVVPRIANDLLISILIVRLDSINSLHRIEI